MPRKKSERTDGEKTKGELSRENLLAAAGRVFHRKGIAQATIRDIAAEAGIALGGLYFHFRSKDEFVAAVLVQGIRALHEDVRRAVEALPDSTPARARLEAAVAAQIVSARRRGDYAMAVRYARTSPAPARVLAAYRAAGEEYRLFWKRLLEESQAAGAIRQEVSPTMLAFFVFGALNWIHEWYDPKRTPIARVIEDFTSFFLDGAAPHPPGPAAARRRAH